MCATAFQYDPLVSTEYLYIHWPFCPYKCTFCPFVAFAGVDQYMGQYHKALCQEINFFKQHNNTKSPIKTIFMGGGTPSTYPDKLLLDMSATLRDVFRFANDLEFTIEVNPGTVRLEQFEIWKEVGINRLSIGVQSLNDKALFKLNRHQSAEDVYFLLDKASKQFDNISVDIIIGLPGVSKSDWRNLVENLVNWPIQHVSMYFLTIHENTMLYRGVMEGKVQLPVDDEVVDQYYWTTERFKQAGFEQYEVSNFARPGFASKHNQAYWERVPYRGFGVGACSFDGRMRYGNDKNLLKYLKNSQEGCFAANFAEELDFKQAWLEKLMLNMRRSKGVNINDLLMNLNHLQVANFWQNLESLQQAGFLIVEEGCLYLTPKGLSVENEIVVKLSI
jgi:putative oxygen-independent coproporphyrinogen III oxidase